MQESRNQKIIEASAIISITIIAFTMKGIIPFFLVLMILVLAMIYENKH